MAYNKSKWEEQWNSPFPSEMKTKAYKWYSRSLYLAVEKIVSEFGMEIDKTESQLYSDEMELSCYTISDGSVQDGNFNRANSIMFNVRVSADLRGIMTTSVSLSVDISMDRNPDLSDENLDMEMSELEDKLIEIKDELKNSASGFQWRIDEVRVDPYIKQTDEHRVDMLIAGDMYTSNTNKDVTEKTVAGIVGNIYDKMLEFSMTYQQIIDKGIYQ